MPTALLAITTDMNQRLKNIQILLRSAWAVHGYNAVL